MKTYLSKITFALFTVILFAGCNLDDPQPSPTGGYVLLSRVATTQGDSREFIYSAEGWLTRLVGNGYLALNENQTSTSNVTFDNLGRIATILTDGPELDTKNVYYYTTDHKLQKLEELIDNQVQSYHTFAYDAQKRLTTRISFYPDASSNSNTLRETNKSTFTYHTDGNLHVHTMYHKPSTSADWQLTQTMTYENYDTMIGVQHLTSGFLFTPSIILQKNNPGKVTTVLASGEQRVSNFTYQYNAQKLPVKKTTTPSTGNAFETVYTYQM
ncbi:hypothetical protein [Rufibacter roseus]|uniref:DUF4595 domain-containing protein n=1 Tax=Rufibacter roseus TaxID=1567108 RepID=A0ABW2DIA8_9BACT|nr:hypothetical protein [Rufibacter roseus]